MPPNPKRNAPRPEFSDEQILKADDPRPQRVTQYPSASSTGRRVASNRVEEAIPTSIYDTEADQEMQAQYGVPEAQHTPAFLFVERGPGAGQLLEVKQGNVVIGRASVADLRLQHPSISRRHAQVRRVGEQFFVKDLGSQNGTFVNKERISGEVAIKPGDTLALGNALVLLRGPLKSDEKAPAASKKVARRDAKDARDELVGNSGRPSNPATSAPRARVATALVTRPTDPPANNALKLAIFAGAIGFGLAAVLAFGLIKAMSGPQSTSPMASTEKATAKEKDKLIDEALKRKMAERPAAAEPAERAPEADIDSDTNVVVNAREPRVRTPAPVAVRTAPAAAPRAAVNARAAAPAADEGDDEAPAAAPKGGNKRTQILAPYEKGNAEASLDLAKKAGDRDLTTKLNAFLTVYDAANEAMMSNNGTAAIINFQKALTLDEGLSSGWGKYGGEIRRKLANLYTLVGLQHVSNGDEASAKKAFQAALKNDPANDRARAQLEKLGGSMPKVADDDEEKPAAPRKVINQGKKPAAKSSSIDDAFGD
jgi:pSer/pThr/pTyr-binding forkhead associated (FHA) protein/tetratricopeptide (TPR) repeat protein